MLASLFGPAYDRESVSIAAWAKAADLIDSRFAQIVDPSSI
jgi:hypothetical protein